MSDFMLLGILRMPIEADDGVVAFTQFRSAARSAADRIEVLIAERDGLLRCVTDNHVALCRAEAAEAERDAAYARGYADAETEISKSALGQKNDFLHSQYANAADYIKALTSERDRLRDATKRVTGRALQEIFVRRMGGAYVDDDPIELEGVSMDGYFNLIQIAEDIRNFICKGSDIDRGHDDD